MNKILVSIVIIIMVFSMSGYSQIVNTYVTKDSSIVIDKVYAGILTGTTFSKDSLSALGSTNVRTGAMGTYTMTKWLSVSSLAMLHIDGTLKTYSLEQAYLTIKPTKKLKLGLGSASTLPTEQRPHPLTDAGHFETWTETQIPGKALSGKVKYQVSKSFEVGAGIAVRKRSGEYSGRIRYKKIQLCAWYSEYNKKLGTALTIDIKPISSVFVVKQDQIVADKLIVELPKDILLYSDMGYDLKSKKMLRGEWGILKTFDSQWVKGLWGLGYNNEAQGINAYLFVHL